MNYLQLKYALQPEDPLLFEKKDVKLQEAKIQMVKNDLNEIDLTEQLEWLIF